MSEAVQPSGTTTASGSVPASTSSFAGSAEVKTKSPSSCSAGCVDAQRLPLGECGDELAAELGVVLVDEGQVDLRRLPQPDLLVEDEGEDREEGDRDDEGQQDLRPTVPHPQQTDANHRPDHSRSSRPVRWMKTEWSDGGWTSRSQTCTAALADPNQQIREFEGDILDLGDELPPIAVGRHAVEIRTRLGELEDHLAVGAHRALR